MTAACWTVRCRPSRTWTTRKLSLTPGGYDEFIRIRTEHAMQAGRAAERVAAQRAHMQKFVDRFRAQATKARQAQARIKALEKLPVIDTVIEAAPTRFDFPEPARLSPPVLVLDKVAAGYGVTRVLSGLSLSVDQDDRIALLGANGNGKSTLAKLIAGRMEPMAGEVRRSPKLRVGYFAQHQTDELVLDGDPGGPHGARPAPRAAAAGPQPVGAVRPGRRPRRHAGGQPVRAARRRGCCWRWRRGTRRSC